MNQNLNVTSEAFKNEELIPTKYSGEDIDISPPLSLAPLDKKSQSIAIIMQDIDAPLGVITHWVIWNIPSQCEIPENIPKTPFVSELSNALQGRNVLRKIGYMGPKPPWGTHRYIFHVYVLDKLLDLKPSSGKKKLEAAMGGHILQYGTLTGKFTHVK